MPALISLQDHVRLREEVFGTTRERMLRQMTDGIEALSVMPSRDAGSLVVQGQLGSRLCVLRADVGERDNFT